MISATSQGYHNTLVSRPPLLRGGPTHLTLLKDLADQELPDARLSASDREYIKRVLAALEARLSAEQLMFLAGAAEDAARRKRSREGCGA